MSLTLDLKIHAVTGQIGIHIIPAEMTIHHRDPQLEVRQIPAAFELQISQPDIAIDQSACRADEGYRGITNQLRNFNGQATSAAASGIERRVSEGIALGRIEKNGGANPAEQAFQDAVRGQPRAFNVDCTPHSPPVVQARLGQIRTSATFARIDTEAVITPVEVQASAPQVNVFMERQPSLTMTVGAIVDHSV